MQPKFIIFIFLSFLCYEITAQEHVQCVDNFPSHKDLHHFINSLGDIVNYTLVQCKQITLELFFGLFLVDVNMRYINDSMPQSYQILLKSVVRENHRTLSCFKTYGRIDDPKLVAISSLFNSERLWHTRQKPLKLKLRRNYEINRELKTYPDWLTFVSIVQDTNTSFPDPETSDKCLVALAANYENPSDAIKYCEVPQVCYDMLLHGAKHGYGMTHRLLFLIAAHFGRGCTVFTSEQDEELRARLCDQIFLDAQYIAHHGFGFIDLLAEQISLCALDGHGEFIRRPWLEAIHRYQTPVGCFSDHLPTKLLTSSARITSKAIPANKQMNNSFTDGTCNAHVTAVAASSIASAIRFIIDKGDMVFVRCRQLLKGRM